MVEKSSIKSSKDAVVKKRVRKELIACLAEDAECNCEDCKRSRKFLYEMYKTENGTS